MKGGLDTLVLRLTNRCNLACGYCYAGSGPAGEDLSPERAAEAVALACPPGGALRIQFTGGEPLLRWDTAVKVLDFGRASGRRFHAAIQTNGTLLTPALCRELRARRVAVGVSLDGVGPDNAARRTPEGEPSFQATARGLQTLAAAGMAANLTAVVSAGSVRGLDRLLDFALWCGNVHGVGLDLVRPQGRGAGAGLSPSPQALAEGLNRLLARHDQLARLGRPVRLKELERLRLLLRTGCRRDCYCNAQTGRSLAVTPDGRLWPCSALAGAEGCLLGTLARGRPCRRVPAPGWNRRRNAPAVPPSACAAGAALPPGGPGPPPWTARCTG